MMPLLSRSLVRAVPLATPTTQSKRKCFHKETSIKPFSTNLTSIFFGYPVYWHPAPPKIPIEPKGIQKLKERLPPPESEYQEKSALQGIMDSVGLNKLD